MSDFESPGSHRRRRSGSPKSSSRRRSRSRKSSSSRRRRRSRSKSVEAGPVSPVSPSRRSDGFQYTKGMSSPGSPAGSVGGASQSSRGFPSFDARDHAPEDSGRVYKDMYNSARERPGSPAGLQPHRAAPMVRGSLRLEGVDFSKYEGLKGQPDVQRLFTTALRDDLISEAGNGVTREDILLKLTPGPIKTVVLDYGDAKGGRPAKGAPTLVDAEWSMDVEYAISARSEAAQVKIAKALFEALSDQELDVRATRAAYVRYINATVENPWKILAVPCSRQGEPAIRYAEHQQPAPQNSTYYSPPPSRSVFNGSAYDRVGGSSLGSPHSQHSNALSPARSPSAF